MNDKKQIEEMPGDLATKVQLYLDGEIGADAFAELQALLKRSAEARALYRSYANMDANLREVSEEQESDDVVPMSPGGRSRGAALLQAVATFILGAAVVYLVLGRGNDSQASSNESEKIVKSAPRTIQLAKKNNGNGMVEDGLAILTQAVGVVWADSAKTYATGDILPADTLRLDKGLLQVEFFSGATVIVEGPATFELLDRMRVANYRGKMRAIVPEFAKGFTVESKGMDIVDLGTEFALEIDENGFGEVHAFDGEVEVHEKLTGIVHNLMAGNGIRIAPGGKPEFLPLNEMGFVDAQRVSFLANAEADEHLARWLNYSEELKAHPDVLLYYSFDEKTAWSRKLRNVRKMVADPLHGAIVGCRWSEGRWDGKGSLEFKRTGDRVRIQIPGKHDEFTLMAWVRIDGFDRDYNSLMLSDNWGAGGVHWQFTRAGELVLGAKHEIGAGHFQSLPVLNQSHLGRWIQLAVSYDSGTKRVAHFVNGEPVWEGKMKQHSPIDVPRGELGNWRTDYKQTGSNIRNLNGRMDEFVVISRGLSDSEMEDLYQRGKPHS